MLRFLSFLKLLVTRRWGWLIIAGLIVLVGFSWGYSSSTTPYLNWPSSLAQQKQDDQSPTYMMAANAQGDVYFYAKDKSVFYVARHNDFQQSLDLTLFTNSHFYSFKADADTITLNDTVQGVQITQAHVIEQLLVYSSGQDLLQTYKTNELTANPNGTYVNRWWPYGVGEIASGLLIGTLAIFAGRKRKTQAIPVGEAIPPYHSLPYKEKSE